MRSIICSAALRYFSFIFLLLITAEVKAQHIDSVLRQLSSRMRLNEHAPPSADLFLHIDKTLYNPSESIWIAAYLLNTRETELHHTLHVLLVNEMTRKTVKTQNFVFDNGIGNGSFYLPDSLQTGEYSLIAYTNHFSNQKGAQFFRKAITIAGSKPPFKILFSGTTKGDSLIFDGKIERLDADAVPGATFSGTVYSDGIPHLKLMQKTGASGSIKFNIAKTDITKRLEILGTISKGKEKMSFKYPLQWSSNLSYINFYPENGQLNPNHPANVAFQIKNTSGKGIAEHCVLLEDGKMVSSFSSDQYGMGLIRFIPQEEKTYQVKIEGNPEVPVQQFPAIIKSSWSVQGNYLVKDSLDIEIISPAAGTECFVIINNSREMIYGARIKLPRGNGRLRVPTAGWPEGIANISILDNQKVLQYKKDVFVDREEAVTVSLNTDSARYRKLSKVKVHVAISDKENKPVKGIFSLSVVADQVYDRSSADIDRFKTYDRFLPQNVILPPFSYSGKAQNIENTLYYLVNEIRKPIPTATAAAKYQRSDRDGYVLFKEKQLKKTVSLLLMGATTTMVNTDERGNFKLPHESLRGEYGSKVILAVAAKFPMGYRIVSESPYKQIDDSLSKQYFMLNHFDGDELTLDQKMTLRSGKMLNEVTIKGIANNARNYFGKADSTGFCDDYVCHLNFLNCRSHGRGSPGTIIPQDGQRYFIDGLTGTEEITYHCQFKGLQPYMKAIAATAYPTEFPFFNIADNNLLESLYQTTLYWQKDIVTDDKGEADVYFYTNERRGDFLITLQGISAKGVLNKKIQFKVME